MGATAGRTGAGKRPGGSGAPRFFGRQDEVADVERRLFRDGLVTLVGVGGGGKTRLAGEIAARLSSRFADGVAIVDLAALDLAAFVLPAVAHAAGVFDASAAGDEVETERRMLDALAGRELLLVLDNCEHLITEVARLAARVAENCAGVCVLATSREPLGVAGEQRLVVGPLDAESASGLFFDRAEAAGATLDVAQDGPLVETICERVDRLALAVELAAARTRVMSLRAIERGLDDSLRLLVSTERLATSRRATMRAALQWSYELLDPQERMTFERLGVFSGGWRLDAAEAVCGDSELGEPATLDLLTRLVDKSLVSVDVGADRYRLLEPVRQFAWEQLNATQDAAPLIRAHRRHYRHVAQDVNRSILRSGLADEDLAELANFRAAIDRALTAGDGRGALTVFMSLGWYWVANGSWREAVDWGRRGLELMGGQDRRVELMAQAMVAGFLAHSGRPREAEAPLQQALQLLAVAPDDYGARYLLSAALLCLGRSPVKVLEEAEQNALGAGDLPFAAYLAAEISRYYVIAWQPEAALVPLQRGRAYIDKGTAAFADELAVAQLAVDALVGRRIDRPVLHRLESGSVSRSGLPFSSEPSLALAVAAEPSRAVAGIAGELRTISRGGWMQRVVIGLACAALARARLGQSDVALTLRGAADRLRERLGYAPLPLLDHLGVDQFAAAAAALGPSAAEQAALRGRDLDDAAAVELACSAVPAPHAGPLSSREAELMTLLAAGFENSQIAERLCVSRRTVDAHLSHIRTKIAVTSRAGLIRWAIDHGLGAPSDS